MSKKAKAVDVAKDVVIAESLGDGVSRVQKPENDISEKLLQGPVATPGNWRKVSIKELADLEGRGLLVGYKPETQEVLVKGEE